MTRHHNPAIFVAIVCAICSSPVLGGSLSTHADAFVDSNNIQWHGSTSFDDDGDPGTLEGNGLEGSVDWAVFTEAAFLNAFPGSGYTPDNDVVYTYQVNVGGTAAVSSLSIGIDNQPASNDGSFSGGGVSGNAPTGSSLGPFSANYSFVGSSISVGGASDGLAYSSPHIPLDFFGSVINGGSSASVIPLPSPSPFPIPEPSTFVLAGLGLVLLIVVKRIVYV